MVIRNELAWFSVSHERRWRGGETASVRFYQQVPAKFANELTFDPAPGLLLSKLCRK